MLCCELEQAFFDEMIRCISFTTMRTTEKTILGLSLRTPTCSLPPHCRLLCTLPHIECSEIHVHCECPFKPKVCFVFKNEHKHACAQASMFIYMCWSLLEKLVSDLNCLLSNGILEISISSIFLHSTRSANLLNVS